MKASMEEGLSQLPGPQGERFVRLLRHGSLSVEVYAPQGHDPQQPHAQDELYIVHRGRGVFLNGGQRLSFTAGDALFVPAGQVHRFEQFSDDLVTWVVFYGPTGGETQGEPH
jgi:mannose-6-phosphate isomerase-like protein (cupin superfamily)